MDDAMAVSCASNPEYGISRILEGTWLYVLEIILVAHATAADLPSGVSMSMLVPDGIALKCARDKIDGRTFGNKHIAMPEPCARALSAFTLALGIRSRRLLLGSRRKMASLRCICAFSACN
jgi:hypothetical protein